MGECRNYLINIRRYNRSLEYWYRIYLWRRRDNYGSYGMDVEKNNRRKGKRGYRKGWRNEKGNLKNNINDDYWNSNWNWNENSRYNDDKIDYYN